jgi:peptidyl-prolyl cis-trans isomerase SurA
MKRSLNFTENPQIKSAAFSLADSGLQSAGWNYTQVINEAICSIGNKNFAAVEFLNYVKASQVKNSQLPESYMKQLYDRWIEGVLNFAEEEKLIQEKPEFKSILAEYREGILLFTIMEKEVWNKASADSLGQQNFYQENRNHFQAGERIHTRIFATDDKTILDGLKEKVSYGDTLTAQDLRKLKSVSNFRAYEKGESKVTDNIPWAIGVHEAQLDGVYYLCEVDKLVPAGIKSFDEARASIISDYQDHLEKEWLVSLKKKFPVSVNTKGKKVVIQELTSKK